MQAALVTLVALAVPLQLQAEQGTPIAKVLSMIQDVESKIIKEGEVSQREYAEFAEWCEDRASNLGYEIKTGKSEVENLKASIASEVATAATLSTKIEELAGAIATNDHNLKAATEIRSAEAADFGAQDKELTEIIDMLERAGSIIGRNMRGGASMMQLKHADNLAQALTVMVQASLIGTSDAATLTAFAQQSQSSQDSDEDEAVGAPAAAAYKSQSGNILDTLQDLQEKAEAQLADARKKETASKQAFEVLQQSLTDEIRFSTKDMDNAKKGLAQSSEKKATATGDLDVTSKDLTADMKTKATLHHDCMTRSESFSAETKSRGEELKALATAKQVIQESTGAALAQVSLLQVARSSLSSGADLANFEVERLVRDLARKQQSNALAQLAFRIASAAHSADPFEKVKGLVSDMIAKLEQEAGADATKKAYCDKELKESNEKKEDKTNEIEKLSTKIDQMSAASSKLKEDIATLESELSKLVKSQGAMDIQRQKEKATYDEEKETLDKAIEGVKLALKILGDYYASDGKEHAASDGAASGIIGLLETVEADFSKNLAEINAEEAMAASQYEEMTKDNEIEKTTKSQDVKYKTKESTYLDKTSAELTSDRSGVQAELDAVLQYLSGIEQQCIAKAETYEARTARREAEIAGLKQALQILESETALIQRLGGHRMLRGRGQHQLALRA